MSWLERPEKKSSNPAVKFLEWKSNDKTFGYWDKEKKENFLIKLPFKFVILEHYHTVKGWNDASESKIFSNEVLFTGSEELVVKSFKGGDIAKGIYKDIKSKVNEAGGRYHRSIYAVTNDLEIVNISLKGAAVSEYSNFIEKVSDSVFDKNWIEVKDVVEGKKGAVKYTSPVFNLSTNIKDKSKLQPFAETLQSYIEEYTNKPSGERIGSVVDKYMEDKSEPEEDDLAF
tara:strand:- start:2860 stop:3546 length:687 start_codon:yes stop_codon:yes gene_type:complete